MLTTVQLACIVMSKSGAPLANFGAQMSTGALLFPTLMTIHLKIKFLHFSTVFH